MTEPPDSQSASIVLSVALAPKASARAMQDVEIDAIVARFRKQLARVLLDAGAREHDLGGNELVVTLGSADDALACALEMQDTFRLEVESEIGSGLYGLDVGIHRAPPGADDGWLSTTGLRVVTALRGIARGRIAISGALRDELGRGGPRVRFHERGDLELGDGIAPVPVLLVSPGSQAADVLSRLLALFGTPRRAIQVAAVATLLVAVAAYTYSLGRGLGAAGPAEPGDAALVDSIEVRRFVADSTSLGSAIHREAIQDRVSAVLGGYAGLRVVASDGTAPGADGEIDVVLTGEVEGAGDWLLVRARLVDASDGTELWATSSYRRVGEIDAVSESIATGVAEALGFGGRDGAARRVAIGEAGPADLDALRIELEDALLQAQQLDLGEDARIVSVNNLADLYYDSGRDEEAIPLYEEVIRLREEAYGSRHPEVAVGLNNLASLYIARGRYAEAEPLYRRSLEIRMRALGPRHPRVANAMSNLALLYHRLGRLAEAEELYVDALEIRKLEAELEPSAEAAQLADRGARFEIDGHYEAAASSYARALDVESTRSGPDHARTAALTTRLAVARGHAGEVQQAESLLQRAIAILTGSVGAEHELTARSMSDLGELYRRDGRLDEARTYHERALTAYENALGVAHPEVADTLAYLVAIFELQGDDEKAAEARDRMTEIRETYLGPVFEYVAARSAEQSVIRDRQHDDLNAPRPLHEYQLEVFEGERVREKRRLAENLQNMALLFLDFGRLAEAEQHATEALELRRAIGDGMHPEVAISLHSLGRIHAAQERYPEAQARFQGALRIFEATLGHVHPYVAMTWSDLADLLERIGQEGQAVYAADRARQTREALAADAL